MVLFETKTHLKNFKEYGSDDIKMYTLYETMFLLSFLSSKKEFQKKDTFKSIERKLFVEGYKIKRQYFKHFVN